MRLFVGAGIPQEQRNSLAAALEPLRPLVPQARWSMPESWHVTLKFLGEVPETQLDEVEEILKDGLARAAPILSNLTEPGAFPSRRRPGVLWMGLADPAFSFRNIAGRLERKFEKAGFHRETRPLRPHLTLARIRVARGRSARQAVTDEERRGVEDFLRMLSGSDIDRSAFAVTEVTLFRSQMQAGGSVYDPRMRFPLVAS